MARTFCYLFVAKLRTSDCQSIVNHKIPHLPTVCWYMLLSSYVCMTLCLFVHYIFDCLFVFLFLNFTFSYIYFGISQQVLTDVHRTKSSNSFLKHLLHFEIRVRSIFMLSSLALPCYRPSTRCDWILIWKFYVFGTIKKEKKTFTWIMDEKLFYILFIIEIFHQKILHFGPILVLIILITSFLILK